MNSIRSFIAIELPAAIHQKLAEVIQGMKGPRTQGIRWVPAENIHLTLKFLGDVSPTQMNALHQVLQRVSQEPAFSISVSGTGAFPNPHRPRVIWAGVKAPGELAALAAWIDRETIPLGFPSENRPFSPHLTLGRVSQNATPEQVRQIAAVVAEQNTGLLGTAEVKEITLFRSDLRSTGAEYSALLKIPLRV
jgi:2'-5' RNA ligase